MALADEDIAVDASPPNHLFGGKLAKDILGDVIKSFHGLQSMSAQFRLQQLGADDVDAVPKIREDFPDDVRFTDTARADDTNSPITERHGVFSVLQ